jgi:putative peptidoglycan lipid II flippase
MEFRIRSFKQAAFWSTAINAFSQVLALLFGMLMAAIFGAQESTDVLYYCLGIFLLLSALIQQVNVSVLVPETMRRRHQVGGLDAMAFINRFFAVFLLVILTLTMAMLADPSGTLTLVSRFSREALERNSALVFWLLISFPLQMVAQLLLDILVSYKFLALPATLSCVNRIINIGFVVLFQHRFGVLSVALGLVLGFAVQVGVNAWLLSRVVRWRWGAWRTRVAGDTYRNIAWVELGTLAGALAGYLPLFLFSGFSAGAMTALNYARRLSSMPAELLTGQISGVIAVKFNELAAQRREDGLLEAYGRMSRLMVFVLTPLSVLLALLGPDIVSILFGRGAFQGAAVEATARLFSLLVLNIPLAGMMTVAARFIVARQAIRFGTGWQIFSALLNAALVAGWVHWLGPIGFPIGLILHMSLYMALLAVPMARRFPAIPLWSVWRSLFATLAACAVAGLPVWWLRARWGAGISPWGMATASTLVFVAGYAAWLFILPPDRMAWQYCREMARAAYAKLRGQARTATKHE